MTYSLEPDSTRSIVSGHVSGLTRLYVCSLSLTSTSTYLGVETDWTEQSVSMQAGMLPCLYYDPPGATNSDAVSLARPAFSSASGSTALAVVDSSVGTLATDLLVDTRLMCTGMTPSS